MSFYSRLFKAILALVVCQFVVIKAQQLTVPITVEGSQFTVRFNPDTTQSVALAQKLCFENASKFQLTESNFENCIKPVAEYFQRSINEYAAKRTIIIPVEVQGNPFRLQFRYDLTNSKAVATKLCTDNAEKLGVTDATFDGCVNPIAEYLQASLDQYINERTLVIPVVAAEKEYTIQFRPDLATVAEVGEQFCVSLSKELNVTQESLPKCVQEVGTFVAEYAKKIYASREIQVPIKIEDMEFTLRMQPTIESATEAAVQLCDQYGDRIGVGKSREEVSECAQKVVAYVRTVVTEAANKAKADAAATAAAAEVSASAEVSAVADVTADVTAEEVKIEA